MNTREILLIGLLATLAFWKRGEIVTTAGKITRGISRGLRNNNPGNIRHSSAAWMGKAVAQTDDEFVTFSEAAYGLRALGVTLRTYFNKHKLRTVRGIINRWAPPNENNTVVYINNVAKALQVEPDSPLDFNRQLPSLMAAIIKHENGSQPYSMNTIRQAIAMM